MKSITIGNDCIFGKNVNFYDHNHVYNRKGLIRDSGFSTSEIIIGNNVWCGTNVTILPGVTIGDNSVIGAGCLVYKDIPENSIIINKQEWIINSVLK
ncbi:acyltransferase [Loigolactobacillus bifermentans]|jgi:acetyltransferase-like isoleucine patch superfamily enzyme|uniref:acyltransferase n=1 Tax=Loigolactobacillus bifermentans TaxID=1607 RepID=UPI0009FAC7D0|nr:acyltransferase [Loigolactobacillus bifermentans]QGG61760.1 acyltransferase [Loigolactobacillus bifermentans]